MAFSTSNPVVAVISSDDLLAEILLHVPAEPLLKLQTVSKQWFSIISNPDFRRRHTRLQFISSTSPASLILLNDPVLFYIQVSITTNIEQFTSKLSTVSLPESFGTYNHLHSCNGLLCGATYSKKCFVMNSCTLKIRKLPRIEMPSWSYHIVGLNMAFDPSKSEHYKVVCVCYFSHGYDPTSLSSLSEPEPQFRHHNWDSFFWIYSSETGIWRRSVSVVNFFEHDNDIMNYDDEHLDFRCGVYWNGAMHWISAVRPFLRFDMEEERLKGMPSVPIPEGEQYRISNYFGTSHGRLYFIGMESRKDTELSVRLGDQGRLFRMVCQLPC